MKSDVLLLACVFEKFIKIAVNEYGFNPLYCVSLLGCTWHFGLEYTRVNLQTLHDQGVIWLMENNNIGVLSSIMGKDIENLMKIKRFCMKMLIIYMDGL